MVPSKKHMRSLNKNRLSSQNGLYINAGHDVDMVVMWSLPPLWKDPRGEFQMSRLILTTNQ